MLEANSVIKTSLERSPDFFLGDLAQKRCWKNGL